MTAMTDRSVLDSTVLIMCEARCQAYGSNYCRKHSVVCCHPRTPFTSRPNTEDTDYDDTEYFFTCPQDTEEETVTGPQPLLVKHTPCPVALWTQITLMKAHG